MLPTMKTTTAPEQLTSIHKAFHVLEFLAKSHEPVALSEVAGACALPKPSAVRLLRILQSLGYADRARGSREYCIGPRVVELAGADPNAILKRQVRPLLEHLYKQLNETVNLGVLSGQRIVYIDFIETTRPLRMIVAPGSDDPWFRTALGRAIASSHSASDLKRLLDAASLTAKESGKRSFSSARLQADLKKFRFEGFAEEREESVEGVGCLAVSLDGLGFPMAAISISLPLQRLPAPRKQLIVNLLKKITKTPKFS